MPGPGHALRENVAKLLQLLSSFAVEGCWRTNPCTGVHEAGTDALRIIAARCSRGHACAFVIAVQRMAKYGQIGAIWTSKAFSLTRAGIRSQAPAVSRGKVHVQAPNSLDCPSSSSALRSCYGVANRGS